MDFFKKKKDQPKDKEPQDQSSYQEMNEEKHPDEENIEKKSQQVQGTPVNDKEKKNKFSFGNLKDEFTNQTNQLANQAKQQASNVQVKKTYYHSIQLQDQFQKVDKSVREKMLAQKKAMNEWIAIKVNEKVLSVMQRLEPKCAESLKHPKMPNCVKSAVDETVHLFWDDISEMVRFELMIRIEKPKIQLPQRKELCKCCIPWYKFRDTYLYALFPYDLQIWDQIRTFWWWFFKLAQSIPIYGVQPGAFFLLFIAIDKSEEFQLTNYILNYKNMQFLTSGCLMAITGFFQYFYCATLYPTGEAKNQFETRTLQEEVDRYAQLEQDQCFLSGPGSHLNIIIDLSTFFFQIILIWIAFILLLFSKSSTEDIQNKSFQTMTSKKGLKGGRLTYFMIYDLIAFLGTVAVTCNKRLANIFYSFDLPLVLGRYLGPLIFFAKCIYGLLSLPFLIFSVGFFRKLFTRAQPTGYDNRGNVVPIMKELKVSYEDEIVDEPIDIGELFEKK